MTRRQQAMLRAGRRLRIVAGIVVLAAGVSYIIFPPNTTIGLFDAAWPPIGWGIVLAISGGVIVWGIRSGLMQVEQLGMMGMGLGAGLLTVSQTLVMILGGSGFTPTRLGGTAVYLAFTIFAAARYFELAADIRAARLARELLNDERSEGSSE